MAEIQRERERVILIVNDDYDIADNWERIIKNYAAKQDIPVSVIIIEKGYDASQTFPTSIPKMLERKIVEKYKYKQKIDLIIIDNSLGVTGEIGGGKILSSSLKNDFPESNDAALKEWVKNLPMAVFSGDPNFANKFELTGEKAHKLIASNAFLGALDRDQVGERIKIRMREFTDFLDRSLGVEKSVSPPPPAPM